MKNSKISDRKLSRKLGVSQPTVTRRRTKLEKEQLLDYTAVPNFEKLGLKIMAVNFARWNPETLKMVGSEEYLKKAAKFVTDHPNIIFVSTGSGFGMDRMFISIHDEYADYSEMMKKLRAEWSEFLARFDSFIISLSSDNVLKQISFKYLADYLIEKKNKV